MRTSLPVSTISYNSESFLANALSTMASNGEISFWAFIMHKGEGGDKDHAHVYVEPAKLRTQDAWKALYFLEYDPDKPDKPKSVTQWRKSKWRDWYLYGLHDKLYLLTKGETKEYAYAREDFRVSDEDAFEEMAAECDTPRGDAVFQTIKGLCECGMTWVEILRTGLVPTRSISAARELYWALRTDGTSETDVDENGWKALQGAAGQAFCEGLFDEPPR